MNGSPIGGPKISRRRLFATALSTPLLSLFGCRTRRSGGPFAPQGDTFPEDARQVLPTKPDYIYFTEGDGSREDFNNILRRREQGYAYNLPGVDITFGDGVPLVSPVAGEIVRVDSRPGDGTRVFIEAGIVGVLMTHLNHVYVRGGQRVDRSMVLGRQGATGALARGKSHTHLSVAGNALVHDVSQTRFRSHRHPDGTFTPLAQLNYLLDPDGLTADGGPLLHAYWHGEDFDTPYEERLAAIEAAIERLVRDHGSSDVTVAIQAAAPLLTDRINALVEAVAERQREHAQDAVARAAQAVFDAVHAARDALVLTSIFIDPGSAEMIRFYKARNPRHHGLIGAYYDRFL